MRICTLLLTLTLTVTACDKAPAVVDLSDKPHSVAEYLADDKLSADTLEACRAKNAADARVMRGKDACINVREAERQKNAKATEAATAKFNDGMEAALEERRRQREASRKSTN